MVKPKQSVEGKKKGWRICVLDPSRIPLMPCTIQRARRLMKRKEAIPYSYKGIFCIKLLRLPSGRIFQDAVITIDTGSKREGYTIATAAGVILNLLTNTPSWVSDHISFRRNLRRSRRQRKTPYRKCRSNKLKNGIAPSTKSRWDARIRVVNIISKLVPITHLRLEDIRFKTEKGEGNQKNINFSILQAGKKYFYQRIQQLYPEIKLSTNSGWQTALHRKKQGYQKNSKKMSLIWEAHCIDSHSMCEMVLGQTIEPVKDFYFLKFLEFNRRLLHVANPAVGGKRKAYGTTNSLGLTRGSVVIWQDSRGKVKKQNPVPTVCFVGGSSQGRISVHKLSGHRLYQWAKKEDIKVVYQGKITATLILEKK